MNLQQAIDKRHSVRQFKNKAVSLNVLKKLVINASKAPSACNRQPWRFVIVSDKGKLEKVVGFLQEALRMFKKDLDSSSSKLQSVAHNFYANMGGAQNVIFIYRAKAKKEEVHVFPNDLLSIGGAVQNLILSAVEAGLGSCWVGSFNGPEIEPRLRKLLGVPSDYEFVSALVIGYPSADYSPLVRSKKKLNEIMEIK